MLLDERADLDRLASGADSMGGPVEAWQSVRAGFACCVAPVRTRTASELGRKEQSTTHEVYVGEDVGARVGDRIRVGGRVLLVQGCRAFVHRAAGSVWVIDCEERLAGAGA